jgi:hypothetical protein
MKSKSPVHRLPRPHDDSAIRFVVQLFARGGARVRTPDVDRPLLETVIQPDGDVITKIWKPKCVDLWGECGKHEWEEYVKCEWPQHVKKVNSGIDSLRRARFILQKLSYLSIMPTVAGLCHLLKEPFGWNWLHIIILYGILLLFLLVLRRLIALVFRCMVKWVATHFSKEEWKPPRSEDRSNCPPSLVAPCLP